MTINDASITNDIFVAVRSLLVASLTVNTGVPINATYNDKDMVKRQIVINPAIVTTAINKYGSDSTNPRRGVTVVISCCGSNTKDVDILRDEVCFLMEQDLIDGLSLINIDESFDPTQYNNNKYFEKMLSFGFIRE